MAANGLSPASAGPAAVAAALLALCALALTGPRPGHVVVVSAAVGVDGALQRGCGVLHAGERNPMAPAAYNGREEHIWQLSSSRTSVMH